jgi:superfamily I DNA/RNA helicase
VWEAVEVFTKTLADRGKRTFLQNADLAARILDAQQVRPYRHVIVDEAQDLHPTQWRLIRAAVRPADQQMPNDLFIVGDAHQRIYDHRVSLSRLGIETRGRSRRLRLNYRTSHQIHRWALAARTATPVDDLDEGSDTSAGSHSAFGGPDPILHGYTTAKEEADAVTGQVASWIDSGIAPHEIAVVARTKDSLARIEARLDADGIPHHRLTTDTVAPDGDVVVGTIHRVKGGEYRCVAIADVSDGQIPLTSIPGAVMPEGTDKLRHQQDMERERSLLYVAATRARDQLSVTWHGAPSPFLEVEPA